jgi:hypothetical protein
LSSLYRLPDGVILPSARGYAIVCGQCTTIGYANGSNERESWSTFSAQGWRIVRRMPYPAYALCNACGGAQTR